MYRNIRSVHGNSLKFELPTTMSTKIPLLSIALGLIMLLMSLATPSSGALQVGFYKGKCGFRDVESIVAGIVAAELKRDRTLVAALLRLQFHDCFVSVSSLTSLGLSSVVAIYIEKLPTWNF